MFKIRFCLPKSLGGVTHLLLRSDGEVLTSVEFVGVRGGKFEFGREKFATNEKWAEFGANLRENLGQGVGKFEENSCELLEQARAQLGAYFAGALREFSVPLAEFGTAFERRVYSALREIPYGQTASYAQIAARVGRAKAARAVGNANAKNPLSIFVPCHRVVGANSLGGYSGGAGLAGVKPLDIKRFLLRLEGVDLRGLE